MRTRKILLGTLAVAAVAAPLALAASPANAATALTNASFENATVTFPEGYSVVKAPNQTLTGWTAGGEGVDIVDKALWNADEGSRSIDLNAFDPGSISQTIDTVVGQTYDLSFAMSGNPDANVAPGPKTMNVSAAGTTTGFTYDTAVEQNSTADMKWKDQTFSFAATGTSTTLTFTSTTTTEGPSPIGVSAAAGPVIDDVVVTAAPNVVKTKVWHTWTGGPVTPAPAPSDAGWHPTSGDPQSKVHKSENHQVGVPYYVPNNGNKGGGSWFLWLETNA
jgi:choice-of-anchor C domain-containing protein